MLLEVRWADETKAKGGDQPSVEVEFGTTFGYFPSSLAESTVSILHPEENGQGYTYWIAFVDQAAKNEPTNGISYRLEVDYDPSFSPVRVTGRVLYKRVYQ